MFINNTILTGDVKRILENSGYSVDSIIRCATGANSIAFELNQTMIVRFPKDEKTLNKLKKEEKVLRFLHGKTPVAIPHVAFIDIEAPFAIHKKIPGDHLSSEDYLRLATEQRDDFAEKIAGFLSYMHSINHERLKHIELPTWDRFKHFPDQYTIVRTLDRETELSAFEKDYLKKFCDYYFSLQPEPESFVFGHCDILPKNVAYDHDKKQLNGLYDFGDCGYIQPAFEFNQICLDWPFDAVQRIAASYCRLSNRSLDLDHINDHALFNRLCFYVDYLRKGKHEPADYLERLRERIILHGSKS